MTVTGVDSVASQSDITYATEENGTMGKDDFLLLLVTQMENQDPLDPMENSEFASQLAQFSSLEQMTNVNTNLESLLKYQETITSNQLMDLLGKTVKADGGTLEISGDDTETEDINLELEADASDVTIYVYGEDGSLVRSISAGSLNEGENAVSWDGQDQNGNSLGEGTYAIEVMALDADGITVEANPFIWKTVDGISLQDGETVLLAGENEIDAGSIEKIGYPTD